MKDEKCTDEEAQGAVGVIEEGPRIQPEDQQDKEFTSWRVVVERTLKLG